MVDFHWSAANLPEAKRLRRLAEGCRTTSGTRSVTDHEPGTRLLLQCVSSENGTKLPFAAFKTTSAF